MANLHSGRNQVVLAYIYAGVSVGVIVLLAVLLKSFSWFLFFAYLILAVTLATAYSFIFLRPPRKKVWDPGVICAPSAGLVDEVELIKNETITLDEMKSLFDTHDAIRIGIHTSRFRLHTSRAPVNMQIVFVAEDPDAVTIGAKAKIEDLTYPLVIKRVAKNNGKKIFTGVKPDDIVSAGDVIGSISSAFRTELFLPAGLGIELVTKAGNRVSAISPAARIYPAAMEKIRQSRFNENVCKEIKES